MAKLFIADANMEFDLSDFDTLDQFTFTVGCEVYDRTGDIDKAEDAEIIADAFWCSEKLFRKRCP